MANPLVVEVIRGPLVESGHRGAVAISNASGRLVLELGDVRRPVYPRSAVKALQAIPLVETAAAGRFGFTDEEIALACASHNGETRHVAAARSMLRKAGLGEGHLECGPQPPLLDADRLTLEKRGEAPGRIHNNCSGKHAGMLALAVHLGADPEGYVRRDHPVQEAVRRAIEEMTDAPLRGDLCGTDGCSIPTWAMPLQALATAFARLATGEGLTPQRADACLRIRQASAGHPFMVAGTGRFCTRLMEETGSRAFVKTGAEGVFCAALPERGLGVALKIDDGATRASEVLMAEIVLQLAGLTGSALSLVRSLARPRLRNRAGLDVGELRVAPDVADRIRL